MVAPTEHNEQDVKGTFGDAVRRSTGSTWTQREYQAICWRARYASKAKVIRQLIDPNALKELIRETEAERKATAGN